MVPLQLVLQEVKMTVCTYFYNNYLQAMPPDNEYIC